MDQREKQQAVGQGNMGEKPDLEQKLMGVVVIKPVFLADQGGDFVQRGALLIVEVTVDVADFGQKIIDRAVVLAQMGGKILGAIKKRLQLKEVKISDGAGFGFAHGLKVELFGFFPQLMADSRNALKQNLPASSGQAFGNGAGNEKSKKAAGHHQKIKPRQNCLKPAGRDSVADVDGE